MVLFRPSNLSFLYILYMVNQSLIEQVWDVQTNRTFLFFSFYSNILSYWTLISVVVTSAIISLSNLISFISSSNPSSTVYPTRFDLSVIFLDIPRNDALNSTILEGCFTKFIYTHQNYRQQFHTSTLSLQKLLLEVYWVLLYQTSSVLALSWSKQINLQVWETPC